MKREGTALGHIYSSSKNKEGHATTCTHLVTVDYLGRVEVSKGPHEERVLRETWFCALEHPCHHQNRLYCSHSPIVVILARRECTPV